MKSYLVLLGMIPYAPVVSARGERSLECKTGQDWVDAANYPCTWYEENELEGW